METSVGRIFLSVTQELQSLTSGIRNNAMIKEPKMKNLHAFVISLVWHAKITR
jgi:hypothetical protein